MECSYKEYSDRLMQFYTKNRLELHRYILERYNINDKSADNRSRQSYIKSIMWILSEFKCLSVSTLDTLLPPVGFTHYKTLHKDKKYKTSEKYILFYRNNIPEHLKDDILPLLENKRLTSFIGIHHIPYRKIKLKSMIDDLD